MSNLEPHDAAQPPLAYEAQPVAGVASTNNEGRDYLRLSEMSFTIVQGSAQSTVPWFSGTVVVTEMVDRNIQSQPRSLWFVHLVPNGPINMPYTVDLSMRPWTVQFEERSLVAAFELGHGEENATRYFVHAAKKESFIHLMNVMTFVKKCLINGF